MRGFTISNYVEFIFAKKTDFFGLKKNLKMRKNLKNLVSKIFFHSKTLKKKIILVEEKEENDFNSIMIFV